MYVHEVKSLSGNVKSSLKSRLAFTCQGVDFMEQKVVLIGLDGASPQILERMVAEGKLPNFAKMMTSGTYGRLRSVITTSSAPAWTTAATGVNPGKHGIFDFGWYDGYSWKLVDSSKRRARPIWQILSSSNRRVCIVNVPITFPPDKVNGEMISGVCATMDSNFTYPPSLRQELIQSGYRIEPQYPGASILDAEVAMDSLVHKVLTTEERRKDTFLRLMASGKPDFAFVVFVATDRLQHFLWNHQRHIEAVYEKMDEIVGAILSEVSDTTNVIIMSDHGFGPVRRCFRPNTFFIEAGLFRLRLSVQQILRKLGITEIGAFRVARRILGTERVGRMVGGRQGFLRRIFRDLGVQIPSTHLATYREANWTKTKAFSPAPHMVKINLMGREPKGIVPPEEYEQLRDHITCELLRYIDPETGMKPVKSVHKREEVFHGPFVEEAPDLVFEMEEGYNDNQYVGESIGVNAGDEFERGLGLSGRHLIDGIFMAIGPCVRSGASIRSGQIADIAPTVLYLMGFPVPTYMDGRVLVECIRPSALEQSPIRTTEAQQSEERLGQGYSAKEEEELLEKLRRLGYVS